MGTLYFGGTIYTMQKENHTVEAVYVENGKIVSIGELDSIKNTYGDKINEEINLNGCVMFPGFVDSHLHIIGHGEKLIRLDLSIFTSSLDITEVLKARIEEANAGDWIIGEGWNENQLADRKIFHRLELDEIAPNNPMILTRVCRHAMLANSKALELAGITSKTENPPGGVIVHDNDGEPTGYLLDQAQELIKSAVPQVSEEYIQKALSVSIDDLVQKGITGGHTEDLNYYGGFDRTYRAFKEIIDGKTKKFRTNLLVHHEVVDDMHQQGLKFGEGTEFVQLGAMKIFADGALGGRTALLSQPYNDAPETSGVAIHSRDELKKLVEKARKYNMPIAIHTIGDLALEYAIDAIEAYPVQNGERDRIIHAQVAREDLLERLKGLPVVLDLQPTFVSSDFPWVIERLGEQRIKLSYAWKTFLQNNIKCAAGSDAPIEDIDPLLGIHAAVTRRHPSENHQGYEPQQKLSVFEAIQLYTLGSAYAVSNEHEQGLIKEGFIADFTVFDQDLFKIQADKLLEVQVKLTIVNNSIVYRNTTST